MFYSQELAGCGWWLSYASEHSIPTFQTTNHLRIVEAVLDFTSTWWCKRDKHILGTSMGVISTGIGGFGDLLVVQPPSRTKLAVQETHDVRPSVQCHEAIILRAPGLGPQRFGCGCPFGGHDIGDPDPHFTGSMITPRNCGSKRMFKHKYHKTSMQWPALLSFLSAAGQKTRSGHCPWHTIWKQFHMATDGQITATYHLHPLQILQRPYLNTENQ